MSIQTFGKMLKVCTQTLKQQVVKSLDGDTRRQLISIDLLRALLLVICVC